MRTLSLLLAGVTLVSACDNPVDPEADYSAIEEVDVLSAQGAAGGDVLALQVIDPKGDNTGPIDVRKMRVVFNTSTGEYRIVITASKSAPFVGAFRINVNLYNPALGTGYLSFLSHTMADFDLAETRTEIVLQGTHPALTYWEKGQEVYTNSLDGTGNPDFTSLFRTSVSSVPHGFLTNEDYIAPRDRADPVKIHGAGRLPD
jgi:hypothetical protein